MALLKLKDLDPNSEETSGEDGILGFDVYTDVTDNKIGTVNDILIDQAEGDFRYLVVDIGFWVLGKKVLLPVGRSRLDNKARRVYVSLSKEQAQALPEFNDSISVDYDYEERVRGIYRPTVLMTGSTSIQAMTSSIPAQVSDVAKPATYSYHTEPSLYEMNDTDHQTLRLYEERLVANKKRIKAGEVAIGKNVETETARVAVPIEKERVVIERITPVDAGTAPGDVPFTEGEVVHLETYEETADIHKEAFVREEVRIRKEVSIDTVNDSQTLRREELDVNTEGN